ncbi:MAG TPA: hypothetical protein VF718_00385 [Allosphingosinicella sp.]|jgi:hypothetical protein
MIVLSACLFLGSVKVLILAAPLVLIGLALAAPALAAMHLLGRGALLRYHLLVGGSVGVLLLLILASLLSGLEPDAGALGEINWAGFAILACPAAAFGAWSGFLWWSFFAGGGRLKGLFSFERLMKSHPNDW